ncbi:A disintegrin and metalloproteinase with thrombospondin motifs 7 [Halotydeus destructor]|nr:A disintegrin and metalloproteinase with thrombospondin motifs 7 [Halotydeus destructor]
MNKLLLLYHVLLHLHLIIAQVSLVQSPQLISFSRQDVFPEFSSTTRPTEGSNEPASSSSLANSNVLPQVDEKKAVDSPAGMSGLNAMFRAMEASKIADYDIKYTEKYLELAVFVGEPAYHLLNRELNMSDAEIVQLVLVYVDQVQTVFYQPSLQGRLHITVVRIDIHKSPMFDQMNGHRDKLLDSFCEFQSKLNVYNDTDARHWDMALYLSSQNFYTDDNGQVNFVAMGLAPVGGVCYLKDNCVIAEFGSVNQLGHPYPSSGLMSAWVAAHEMAHNIGIFHDGQEMNKCPGNGFIMSSSRGTKGEVNWSTCSAKMFSVSNAHCLSDVPPRSSYDHRAYNLTPGQFWDVHDQCKLFLKDENARAMANYPSSTICEKTIVCESPNRIGFYSIGPALDGTYCDKQSVCLHGLCQKTSYPLQVAKGDWSPWRVVHQCESKCIVNSFGHVTLKRTCNNPKPRNTNDYCQGDASRVTLCEDTPMCPRKHRITANEYASQQCSVFASYLNELNFENGIQVGHDGQKDWRACAIFCKIQGGPWYTPRYELNDLPHVQAFFPDGTLCHQDEEAGNFYCQQHRCVRGNTRRGKLYSDPPSGLVLSNLNTSDPLVVAQIKEYFTLYEIDRYKL